MVEGVGYHHQVCDQRGARENGLAADSGAARGGALVVQGNCKTGAGAKNCGGAGAPRARAGCKERRYRRRASGGQGGPRKKGCCWEKWDGIACCSGRIAGGEGGQGGEGLR